MTESPSRRDRILEAAMRHFADRGYRGTRVEDVANEVGVAKGTVFLDFGSKEGLFLEAFKRAVSLLPAWLDAPTEIVDQGFWAVLDWWLQRAEDSVASVRGRTGSRSSLATTPGSTSAGRSIDTCGARTHTGRSTSWSSASSAARSETTSTPR